MATTPVAAESNRPVSFPVSRLPAVNVSQVPQRCPCVIRAARPGCDLPHIRDWLHQVRPRLLVEPFAGGGIVSLTAVMENLVERCVMIESNPDVAAFWHAVLQDGEALAQRIEDSKPTREHVEVLARTIPASILDQGVETLVQNRTRWAGILASGAALIRHSDSGQGLASRWYPATLARRIRDIQPYTDRIAFCQGDALQLLTPFCMAGSTGQLYFSILPIRPGQTGWPAVVPVPWD